MVTLTTALNPPEIENTRHRDTKTHRQQKRHTERERKKTDRKRDKDTQRKRDRDKHKNIRTRENDDSMVTFTSALDGYHQGFSYI